MYKWYNVRVLRKLYDVGSFFDVMDGQAAVESCSVCSTILYRSLQSEESKQIRMSGLNTSSQCSMEALYTALLARKVSSRTDFCDGPMQFFYQPLIMNMFIRQKTTDR